MGAEFERPWILLLLIPAAAVLLPLLGKKRDSRLKLDAAVRSVILALLILALSGISAVFPGGGQTLLVVADRSGSMQAHADEEAQLIDSVEKQKGSVQTGLLAFGADAAVEYMKGTGRFTGFDTKVDANLTGIAKALNMGSVLLPQDSVRRMLLITDGLENDGDMLSAARSLAAAGIRMDVAYLPPKHAGEAQVTSLNVPGYLHTGESCDVVVTVDSNAAGKATLRLYCDRSLAGSQDVELQKGENRFVFNYKADKEGIHTWMAELSAPWDANSANNRADAYTRVIGRPAVLLAADDPAETEQLARILQAAGYIVDRKGAVELGGNLDDYMKYQAIVLGNVPAQSLGDAAVGMLDAYTRVLGRGLLVTGGQDSFALGGYDGTKLEGMLPVNSKIENYADMPKLALVLVIDHSGSMEEGQYGISKRQLAVEAAIRSTQILQPNDEVGVIAFDDTYSWALPMQKASDKDALQKQISTIGPGGGTMMYNPMAAARDALAKTDAQLKHIILLTDGMPADTGFEALAADMKARGITLSTVAVGKDADRALLSSLADLGGGRTYAVDEFNNIVSIFAKETYLATGEYLQNRTFTPAVTSFAPAVLSQGLPPLHGYVNTTPKQAAEVQLVSDRDHVIYARWRYGLGRTAVWTSDVKGLWSQDWLASPNAVRYISSLVSQVLPEDEGSGALEASMDGGQAVVTLKADTVEGAQAQATVVAPDNSSFNITLDPVSPGEFEARFDASDPGTYIVRATQKQPGMPDVTAETGVSSGWSREYDLRQDDPKPKLEEAAKLTGGKLVSSASELFAQNMQQKKGRADLTGVLLLAALFLFVLDVAMRRMRWDARLLAWFASRRLKTKIKQAIPAASSAPAARVGDMIAGQANENEVAVSTPKSKPAKGEKAEKPAETASPAQALLNIRKQQKRF